MGHRACSAWWSPPTGSTERSRDARARSPRSGKILDPVADRARDRGRVARPRRAGSVPGLGGVARSSCATSPSSAAGIVLATRGVRIEVRWIGKVATFASDDRDPGDLVGDARPVARRCRARGRMARVRGGHRRVLRRRGRVRGRPPAGAGRRDDATSARERRSTIVRFTGRCHAARQRRDRIEEEASRGVPRGASLHEGARVGRVEGERVRVGITDFAQDALGDVVYVDLPGGRARSRRDQPFGEVESTKSVSDVFSPLAGTILERNPLIDERPELVERAALRRRVARGPRPRRSGRRSSGLLDADAYRAFTEGRPREHDRSRWPRIETSPGRPLVEPHAASRVEGSRLTAVEGALTLR